MIDPGASVILEGPDGGGKSTLAERLSKALGMTVQQGSGPPRGPGEIETRTRQYLELKGVVFDRHPAVSQYIYGRMRAEPMSQEFLGLVAAFYRAPGVCIYCRSTSPDRHVVKDSDNPDHVAMLTAKYQELVRAYDIWALGRADLVWTFAPQPRMSSVAGRLDPSSPSYDEGFAGLAKSGSAPIVTVGDIRRKANAHNVTWLKEALAAADPELAKSL